MPSPAKARRSIRVEGSYDDAVRILQADADANGWTIVSDTAWPGYERIPVPHHAGLHAHDGRGQGSGIRDRGSGSSTHVFVQGGVGGLLCAVASWCAFHRASLQGHQRRAHARPHASRPRRARDVRWPSTGPLTTTMAGLRNREVSPLAFESLLPNVDAFMAIDDEWAFEAMRALRPRNGDPASAGASGSAALGGLLALCRDRSMPEHAPRLGLSTTAPRSLVIVSEGVTDPDVWRVGRPQRDTTKAARSAGVAAALRRADSRHDVATGSAPVDTQVHDSDDPLLSIWRISWIAHILPRIARRSAERQHLPSREAHARLHRCGAAPGPCRGAADLVRRFAGHDLQRVAAAVDRAFGMGDVALRALSHRATTAPRCSRGLSSPSCRSVSITCITWSCRRRFFLPLTLLYFERTLETGSRRDAALMMAAFVGAGVLLHLLLDLPRDGAGADRRDALVEDAARRRDAARHSRARSRSLFVGAHRGGAVLAMRTRSTATTLGERLETRHPAVFRDARSTIWRPPLRTWSTANGARRSASPNASCFLACWRSRWRRSGSMPSIAGA